MGVEDGVEEGAEEGVAGLAFGGVLRHGGRGMLQDGQKARDNWYMARHPWHSHHRSVGLDEEDVPEVGPPAPVGGGGGGAFSGIFPDLELEEPGPVPVPPGASPVPLLAPSGRYTPLPLLLFGKTDLPLKKPLFSSGLRE